MTTNLAYQPTFLQKLLGKNYKWLYVITYYFKANTYYLWNEIFYSLNKTFVLLTTLVVFTFLDKTTPEILTYLLVGAIFLAATDPSVSWFLGTNIKNGQITRFLILPGDFLNFVIFIGIGNTFYFFISYIISLLPILLFFSSSLIFSWNVLWLFLFYPICIGIRLFIETLTGLLAFWTTEFSGMAALNATILFFFCGASFPLNFISNKLPILEYTPYSILFYHPMQIYLGKYNTIQTIGVFVGGLAWCLVLYFLAKLVFKLGLKRNESVGL
jgi:ABC-2 type transport system permease protein